MEPRDLRREITDLRQQLRRNQVYLTAALAAIGLGMLVSIGLVGYYGMRLGESVWQVRSDIATVDESSRTRTKALSMDLLRQERELAAIRDAANRDLVAIQEAHRKIASIRDPRKELSALREANEALWTELASQRADILDALQAEEETTASAHAGIDERFRLGDTDYVDPRHQPDELKGFIKGDVPVYQASVLPGNPAHLLIEVSPPGVQLGDPYRLAVRVVNRTNEPLDASKLRLDWSFGGKNTGGDVPLGVGRVAPLESAVLYQVSGHWTPAHEDGPVAVKATLTLNGGRLLANTLRW